VSIKNYMKEPDVHRAGPSIHCGFAIATLYVSQLHPLKGSPQNQRHPHSALTLQTGGMTGCAQGTASPFVFVRTAMSVRIADYKLCTPYHTIHKVGELYLSEIMGISSECCLRTYASQRMHISGFLFVLKGRRKILEVAECLHF
jgi:hypothetical protein